MTTRLNARDKKSLIRIVKKYGAGGIINKARQIEDELIRQRTQNYRDLTGGPVQEAIDFPDNRGPICDRCGIVMRREGGHRCGDCGLDV